VISRREFLKNSGLLAAALAMPVATPIEDELREVMPRPSLSPSSLAAFVDPLPIPEIARPIGDRPDPMKSGARIPCYRIEMHELMLKLHRDLPPTRVC
jgi:spore coat protein A, manganese oxidase